MTEKTKRCSTCKETKPASEFYPGQSPCKECQVGGFEAGIMAKVRRDNRVVEVWNQVSRQCNG